MPIYALGEYEPDIHETAYVHPDAVVIGRVRIGSEASVWPCAVLRGDHGRIEVGARTSVQDGTVVHCTHEWPTLIGAGCVVGHNAHLEGCVVEDGCLIGSGSVTLNRVRIGSEASVWPCAVLRGDHGRIEVGARTSVQDGTVVHCTHEWPTLIGAGCVVGHNAHLEGCVVEDGCLIGSGSVTLNRVRVGAGAIVAAASLVPEGFEVPPATLVAGVPARIKRTGVPADWVENAVKQYVESGRAHRAGLRRLA